MRLRPLDHLFLFAQTHTIQTKPDISNEISREFGYSGLDFSSGLRILSSRSHSQGVDCASLPSRWSGVRCTSPQGAFRITALMAVRSLADMPAETLFVSLGEPLLPSVEEQTRLKRAHSIESQLSDEALESLGISQQQHRLDSPKIYLPLRARSWSPEEVLRRCWRPTSKRRLSRLVQEMKTRVVERLAVAVGGLPSPHASEAGSNSSWCTWCSRVCCFCSDSAGGSEAPAESGSMPERRGRSSSRTSCGASSSHDAASSRASPASASPASTAGTVSTSARARRVP